MKSHYLIIYEEGKWKIKVKLFYDIFPLMAPVQGPAVVMKGMLLKVPTPLSSTKNPEEIFSKALFTLLPGGTNSELHPSNVIFSPIENPAGGNNGVTWFATIMNLTDG
jgi:hypothetical protein